MDARQGLPVSAHRSPSTGLVVYASSRWRPIRIVYESSAALLVRFGFVSLLAHAKRCHVIMLTCDRMNFDVYSFILLLRYGTT